MGSINILLLEADQFGPLVVYVPFIAVLFCSSQGLVIFQSSALEAKVTLTQPFVPDLSTLTSFSAFTPSLHTQTHEI